VRLLCIWMSMVPGDARASAVAAARKLDDPRATHLWDPANRIGLLWTEHFAPRHLDELRQALAGDERLAWIEQQLASGQVDLPTWDCALFFRAGAPWSDPLPEPDGWMKQFGYWPATADGEEGGDFWTSHSPNELVHSTWPAELERGLSIVLSGR